MRENQLPARNDNPLAASTHPKIANVTEGDAAGESPPNKTYENDAVPKAARFIIESAVAAGPSLT